MLAVVALGFAAAGIPSGVAGAAGPVASARRDTVRQQQWHLDALRIPEVQKVTQGAGVIVGLIDGGVYAQHPDLAGQILPGHGFGPGYGNADGLTDIRGDSHGTSMAGIIVAKGGSSAHALGIAPQAKILSVPLVEAALTDADLAGAIRYCVDHGAKVINMSFAGQRPQTDILLDAVRYALNHDVVLVAAAGDTENRLQHFPPDQILMPAALPGVIAVGSVMKDGSHDPRTVTGPQMALVAPGELIGTTALPAVFSSGYALAGEASASAAIVSGVVALIRARYPQLDAKNVINRLIRTAGGGGQARNSTVGFGEVNPYAAVFNDVPAVTDWPLGFPPAQAATSPSTIGGDRSNAPAWLLPALGMLCLLIVVGAVLIPVLLVSASRRRARARAAQPLPPFVPR
jgi:subtilisin family serine protease